MGRRVVGVACAVLLVAVLAGCSSSGVPKSFPSDLPIPPGRVISVEEGEGKVQFTVESSLAMGVVPEWYEKELAGKAWKAVDPAQPLFAESDTLATAEVTDGTRVVSILVTDLGNTTKVSLSTETP
jgi:hypothetical protein